ncbi:hydroperoxide isomerase ALOXE3-like [Plectropomus leopardus]|uniref:hydroperoxide isomerase ALOXE3-like n=1 Tax=Plectropomus leopardus TaxID=160734 RepID=UPI001C4A9152|nr:hydroperoxide isomerase ALOXE3-like [Plectropomus leopardus]XP_042359017.1 hydroperoxide isomerase ALOXE3-like [Plectropomus leopardus]XP_042359019.1 hydroperoxide isomerase ALOXE3-like [Plectropomus leopardus]XP_042359020.1 hydroperoxide isomerase ALOXE3-like [Plectropomus leopardus]
MAEYKLEVTTGDMQYAGTWDHIYVTLFGTEGQSERTKLGTYVFDFSTGTTGTYTMKTNLSLGKLLLVKMEKDPFLCLPEDEWFFSKVVVTTPEGEAILFPCYRWISRGELVELRGGRAMKDFEEVHSLLIEHRKNELIKKKSLYQWKVMGEGQPHINHLDDVSQLSAEIRYSKSKATEVYNTKTIIGLELKLKGMIGSTEKWERIEDMKKIFWCKKTTMSEYVSEHWKEDDFYGYQFLNAINPNMIKRCSELPPNFPVTEEMVKPFLAEGSSLQKEMEKGNIFLCDYKQIDGIPPRDNNDEPLHVTAGLCLFYMNLQNKLMPIAIQLHQQPSEQNPIFLPSDPEADWLLAKMFIKNADLLVQASVHHLMNPHFLAEAYNVAALRSFSEIHPLYKLLFPHFRYTIYANTTARKNVYSPDGILSTTTIGYHGLSELMRRALPETTYSSLCLPDNITARGLESIPNFYYRDDGLKLWNIINGFVKAVVEHYYPSDSEVCKDTELQEWINEIFTHGFLGNKATGIPTGFNTIEEVIKFITMVIFTVTAQHAAVHHGQYDYHAFAPNGILLLHNSPPTTKGQSRMKTILETLPNVDETVKFVAMSWIFSNKYMDMVYMGTYPEERFDEPAIKEIIKTFQTELSTLSDAITARNSQLEVPYIYLNPAQIENSVTI